MSQKLQEILIGAWTYVFPAEPHPLQIREKSKEKNKKALSTMAETGEFMQKANVHIKEADRANRCSGPLSLFITFTTLRQIKQKATTSLITKRYLNSIPVSLMLS